MTTPATTELCPGCFADKGLVNVCPHCGYDESLKRGPLVLPHRTLLHQGQYLIGKVLGKPGGFGITYLALDTKLETRVAIKEYLPRDLAGRDGDHATVSAHSTEDGEFFRYGLTQFLQEARTLARFDHANIVRVRNFFEENGTGYLVMDYYDGITLADYLAQQPQGKLPEKTAVDILMPILDGLREVHAKNFLHRDIKPQNIYLTTGNRAILLDFGAARQAMSERSRSLSVVLSEGYAPYEQYHRRGEQGPWTDIYASAAVLYHAVSGQAPPPATERVSKDELDIGSLGVSASLTNALRLGLAIDHHNRPQTMTEFQTLLLTGTVPSRHPPTVRPSAPSAPLASAAPPKQPPGEVASSQNKSWWIVVVVLLLAGAGWLTRDRPDKPAPVVATAPKPEPPAPVPPPKAAATIATVPPPPDKLPTVDAPAPVAVATEMQPGKVFKDCPECPEMVVIPAGSFDMGNVHRVTLKSFAMGKTEVTQGQWQAVIGGTPSYFMQCGSDCPVELVTWDDVQIFIQNLNVKTGKSYRLPSEAQWEYAALAGRTGEWSFGSDESQLGQYAWYTDNSGGKTHSVAGKQANAWGLYDMSGNVMEWTQDCWNGSYSGAPVDGSAWTAGNCGLRVLRGGAWSSYPHETFVLRRFNYVRSGRNNISGFRLARMLP